MASKAGSYVRRWMLASAVWAEPHVSASSQGTVMTS